MAKAPRRQSLSDGELDALRILWEDGPLPAGAVRDRLNAAGRGWAYTTTKTVLDRLERKGYVRRKRTVTPHLYLPIVSPDALARDGVGRLRRDLFDGAGLPMIRALIEGSDLTAEDLVAVRALLDRLESDTEGGR